MDLDKEAAIFEAACEKHKAMIDGLPLDSVARERYVEGLADGIAFALKH